MLSSLMLIMLQLPSSKQQTVPIQVFKSPWDQLTTLFPMAYTVDLTLHLLLLQLQTLYPLALENSKSVPTLAQHKELWLGSASMLVKFHANQHNDLYMIYKSQKRFMYMNCIPHAVTECKISS